MKQLPIWVTKLGVLPALALWATLLFSAEPLVLVYFDDYPPFSYRGPEGRMVGILPDIFEEALEVRLHMELAQKGLPWARAQHQVKLGQADGFCTIPTPERRTYVAFNRKPVMMTEIRIFTSRTHPKLEQMLRIERLDQLAPFTITSYMGSGWAQKNLSGYEVFWPHSLEQSLIMVINQRADVLVDVSHVVLFKAQKSGFKDRLLTLPPVLEQQPFHLGIATTSPHVGILDEFDRIFGQMQIDGGYQTILERYP